MKGTGWRFVTIICPPVGQVPYWKADRSPIQEHRQAARPAAGETTRRDRASLNDLVRSRTMGVQDPRGCLTRPISLGKRHPLDMDTPSPRLRRE